MGKDDRGRPEEEENRNPHDINYIAYEDMGMDDIMDEADEVYFALLLSGMDRNWSHGKA